MFKYFPVQALSTALLLMFLLPAPAYAAETKTVEIFVTSWCGYCKKLEKFLKKEDIPFTRYDIETNERAAQAFESMGGTGVPVTRIGSEIVYGYDPDRIRELL